MMILDLLRSLTEDMFDNSLLAPENIPEFERRLVECTGKVKILLENNADPNEMSLNSSDTADCPDFEKDTALSYSLYWGYFEISKLLIQFGADVNKRWVRMDDEATWAGTVTSYMEHPLHALDVYDHRYCGYHSSDDFVDIVEFLGRNGADFSAKSVARDHTFLMRLAFGNGDRSNFDLNLFQSVLKYSGAEVINFENGKRETALNLLLTYNGYHEEIAVEVTDPHHAVSALVNAGAELKFDAQSNEWFTSKCLECLDKYAPRLQESESMRKILVKYNFSESLIDELSAFLIDEPIKKFLLNRAA